MGLLAWPALAGLPASLDRVPESALVVASVRNIESFSANVNRLNAALPASNRIPLGMMGDLMGTAGLNAGGSISLALMPSPDGQPLDMDGEQGPLVVIVPVTDANAFVQGLGGTPGAGIMEVQVGDETAFAKDIGGGYVVMGPVREVVQAFSGEGGQGARHERAVGPVGLRVAQQSDTVIIANIPALRPQLEQGLEGMKEQAQMFAMMAGQQGDQVQQQMQMVEMVAGSFLRDARVGMVGLGFGETGVRVDLAANFNEGSEIGGFFDAPGDSRGVLARVPDVPFLFAGSADFSSPGMQKLMNNMTEMAMQANEGLPNAMNPATFMQGLDGIGYVIGTPGALMGGLFTNTVYYYKTSDPEAYTRNYSRMLNEMNGMQIEGMTYTTAYQGGGAQVEGQQVDTYSMSIRPNPNDPGAMQAQQMMMMMFGPSMGASGYIGKAEGGLVMTMSQNTPLMSQAMRTAENGNGLARNRSLRSVAEQMPEGATFESYIGVGSIFTTVNSFLAMMGAGMDIQVPADLAPIGIGGTTDRGGFQARVVVPTQVIETFAAMAQQFEEMNGAGEPAPAPARPRF
ncbi:MAG: hypothetical protein EA378_00210 [Phycisphaerales bacterium]|nr:MAG: hypothetical protein EA378_00210 [Phycisphaerales bacterium]